MAKIKAADVNELADGEAKRIDIDGRPIVLVKDKGKFYAIEEACPHAGCSLADFSQVSEGEVECTCHGSKFNLKTGQVTNPPATEPLKTYPVLIEGGDVFVEI
jgi:3-phenylpropionate/trans-cinnamate dioxygenase ferredoxin subunit